LKNSNSAFKGSGKSVNESIAVPGMLRLIGLLIFLIGTILALAARLISLLLL
jgi:hypothetical protein